MSKKSKKSKNIVLITSAIYTNYGIYNTQQRIEQTLETAKSAKEFIPNAVTVLIDNSKDEIQNDDSKELNELIEFVDYYIDNSEDPDMQFFHQNVSNYDIGKNAMETFGLLKTLNHFKTDDELINEIKNSDRIFKLSGRYKVTEQFNFDNFSNKNTKDKYVFKKAQPAWIDPVVTRTQTLLQTRLWSFTPGLLDETIELYKNISNNMMSVFNNNQYIDIEHSMSRFVPKDKLVELETVGLVGNIAPNGMMIID